LANYFINTEDRFFKYYFPNYNLSPKTYAEFYKIYKIYEKEIKNDATNKLATLIVILWYSLHGVEKIKSASRAFKTKYFLPFMSENVIQYAFSIPCKYKIGLRHGKKIMITSYPEIKKMKFVSGGFSPESLKKRQMKDNHADNTHYEEYYLNNWLNSQYHKVKK
jgi:hypothetical protein